MDEIKRITKNFFDELVLKKRFPRPLLLKDYYLVLILYLIRNVAGIYFKGGTALNKIFLNHARLSEDIDFTLTRNEKEVKEEISTILHRSTFFQEISEGKNVDGFLRMIIRYDSDLGTGELFIDLNAKGKLMLTPEVHQVHHFYAPFIPEFSIKTVAQDEMIAEKVAATIGRNKPRDHFDVYKIIHAKLPINLDLVKKKCTDSGDEFSILKMFNKAKMLKNRWDQDMLPLLAEEVSFQTVMKYLAQHFNLKQEKSKAKKKHEKRNNI